MRAGEKDPTSSCASRSTTAAAPSGRSSPASPKYYRPEELVGKTVVAILNLPPRKMMGMASNGMLLSAEKDGKLNLLMLDDSVPAGAQLC